MVALYVVVAASVVAMCYGLVCLIDAGDFVTEKSISLAEKYALKARWVTTAVFFALLGTIAVAHRERLYAWPSTVALMLDSAVIAACQRVLERISIVRDQRL